MVLDAISGTRLFGKLPADEKIDKKPLKMNQNFINIGNALSTGDVNHHIAAANSGSAFGFGFPGNSVSCTGAGA